MVRLIVLCALTILSACASISGGNVTSVVWVQKSAEYRAATIGIYNSAKASLEKLRAESQKKIVVIMDVDETVLDNSAYQAMLIISGKRHDSCLWNEWILRGEAGAVPGAVEFIRFAIKKDAKIFFITNRRCTLLESGSICNEKKVTIDNLIRVGIENAGNETVFLENESLETAQDSDKEIRRKKVIDEYRDQNIMIIGDNLGDFLSLEKEKRNDAVTSPEIRKQWGEKWFLLPNPMYGQWQGALDKKPISHNLTSFMH